MYLYVLFDELEIDLYVNLCISFKRLFILRYLYRLFFLDSYAMFIVEYSCLLIYLYIVYIYCYVYVQITRGCDSHILFLIIVIFNGRMTIIKVLLALMDCEQFTLEWTSIPYFFTCLPRFVPCRLPQHK